MPKTGKNKSVRGGGIFISKAKDSGSSWDFCYAVGSSIKTLLARELHFLWKMGMGPPSRAGRIWALWFSSQIHHFTLPCLDKDG